MKLRLAQWLLMSLFPLMGTAQSLPSLAPVPSKTPLVDELLALDGSSTSLAQGAPVVPIWSGSNGQLLAVVALPRDWNHSPIERTPGYVGPSSWHLAGSSTVSGGGLSWQLNNGFHAEATFGQYLAAPSVTCTAADCNAAATTPWARNSLTGALGLGWTTPDGAMDLSYGLSWLQSQSSGPAFGQLSLGNGVVPVLTLPNSLNSYGLESEASLYARGRWQFEDGPALDVAASYGRGRLSALGQAGLPGIDLDQLSLSLGLGAGSLRGAIVGHVLRSDDPMFAGKRWTTLDLGVSWRTPWSGELSVGTQNILNAPLNTPRDADGQQNRTPYIQYRQDL